MNRLLRDPFWRTAVLLGVAVLFAYAPVWNAGFVWDDDDYVTQNPVLRSLGGLFRIWFEPTSLPQYYPLVHTTFWLEYQLFGLNATVYHVVNVLLHAANAVLLLAVLRRIGVPGAAFAALVFALHPVHVESVAWITERKNVLSGLLYLAALRAWLIGRPLDGGTGNDDRSWYAKVTALFVGALLSKTVACSLPAALLLLIWWKRGRIARADLRATAPLFVLGLCLAAVTVWIEKVNVVAEGAAWDLTMIDRVLIASRALLFYLGSLLWPVDLAFSYPRWEIDAADPLACLPLGVVIVGFAGLLVARHRLGRGPLVAALFFAGTLVPALGFFDVFPMRYSFVADHFQYLASLGPIALCAAICAAICTRATARSRPIALGLATFAGVTLGALTWQQCGIYRDLETLWTDTLVKNPRSGIAHVNLGRICSERGDVAAAAAHFDTALQIDPGLWEAHAGRGALHFAAGEQAAARADFEKVVALAPRQPFGHHQLGLVLAERGDFGAALRELDIALRLAPEQPVVHSALALTHARSGDNAAAFEHLTKALELAPNDSATLLNAADVMMTLGNAGKATEICVAVLRAAPHHVVALGRLTRAIAELTRDASTDETVRIVREVSVALPNDAATLIEALVPALGAQGRASTARAVEAIGSDRGR